MIPPVLADMIIMAIVRDRSPGEPEFKATHELLTGSVDMLEAALKCGLLGWR